MANQEGKVVVVSSVTMSHNETEGLFAASFAEMGLTGFGNTPDEARHNLKMVFRTFIRACREHGVLEKALNRLEVQWGWEKDHPSDGPEYEDTDDTPWTAGALEGVLNSAVWSPGEQVQAIAANNDLAMAA